MKTALKMFLGIAIFYSTSNYDNSRLVSMQQDKMMAVGPGEICYNRGPLESMGFIDCSAVILDFGNSALMAHAYKNPSKYNFVSTDDVVDKMLDEANKKNLKADGCEAIVDAGCDEALVKITKELRKHGIKVRIADTRGAPRDEFSIRYRDVRYDPLTERVTIDSLSSN
jgi:ribosome-associated translation inhibitor RaiA